jgi:hypothetical protein
MIGRFYEAHEVGWVGDIRFMSTSLVDACQLRKTSTTPKSGNGESKVWGGKNKKKTVDKLSKLMSNASQDRLEFFSSALKV